MLISVCYADDSRSPFKSHPLFDKLMQQPQRKYLLCVFSYRYTIQTHSWSLLCSFKEKKNKVWDCVWRVILICNNRVDLTSFYESKKRETYSIRYIKSVVNNWFYHFIISKIRNRWTDAIKKPLILFQTVLMCGLKCRCSKQTFWFLSRYMRFCDLKIKNASTLIVFQNNWRSYENQYKTKTSILKRDKFYDKLFQPLIFYFIFYIYIKFHITRFCSSLFHLFQYSLFTFKTKLETLVWQCKNYRNK